MNTSKAMYVSSGIGIACFVLEQIRSSAATVLAGLAALLLNAAMPMQAVERQVLRDHVPRAVAESRVVGQVARSQRMNLVIALPLHNQDQLDARLKQVIDPASPNFRHFMTPDEFTEQFGPTTEEYQKLQQFARSNGLMITGTHSNRTLLDVSGEVSDIERTMHVNVMNYQHSERGAYYAPNRNPTIDIDVKVLAVRGLDNFSRPHRKALKMKSLNPISRQSSAPRARKLFSLPFAPQAGRKRMLGGQHGPPVTGSGRQGGLLGRDFRAAYAPGVTLDGTGQTIGLFELEGFYAADVIANAQAAGLPVPSVQTVLTGGVDGKPVEGFDDEAILDIMMAYYMAPGAKIIVYEGPNEYGGKSVDDLLNRMATDDKLVKQISCSWYWDSRNAEEEQIFEQFAMQGQSFFNAVGDNGAFIGGIPITPPSDEPYITQVGGTSLYTAGAGGPWQSETAWRSSGGGVSNTYKIPDYQRGINMTANGGSTTMRNIPDVATVADVQLFLIIDNTHASGLTAGTSASAPLWAGFTALVNQQAAALGYPSVGFLNPAIYAIGNGPNYAADFHDITSGNNNNSQGGYNAVPGYDLVTGWGSPTGQHLIDDLVNVTNAQRPGFTLSASPTNVILAGGSIGLTQINVLPVNGFTGSVSPLQFAISSPAPLGTHSVTVTGTYGGLQSVTTIQLNIVRALLMAPQTFTLAAGQSTTASITVSNAALSSVTLVASGLPSGINASFGPVPAGSTGTSSMTLRIANTVPAGTYHGTVTGTINDNGVVYAGSFTMTVLRENVPTTKASPVNFSQVANVVGIVTDGLPVANGGLDGLGHAYWPRSLGLWQFALNGVPFVPGIPDGLNAVTNVTVPLPQGKFSALQLEGTGVNGNQPGQIFVVRYTDNTVSNCTLSLSDWYTPQHYTGEDTIALAYRGNANGTPDNRTFNVYQYSCPLDSTKTVSTVTLPANNNVVVLAITETP